MKRTKRNAKPDKVAYTAPKNEMYASQLANHIHFWALPEGKCFSSGIYRGEREILLKYYQVGPSHVHILRRHFCNATVADSFALM